MMGGDHGTRSVERAAAPHPGGRGAARRGLSAACGLPDAAAAGACGRSRRGLRHARCASLRARSVLHGRGHRAAAGGLPRRAGEYPHQWAERPPDRSGGRCAAHPHAPSGGGFFLRDRQSALFSRGQRQGWPEQRRGPHGAVPDAGRAVCGCRVAAAARRAVCAGAPGGAPVRPAVRPARGRAGAEAGAAGAPQCRKPCQPAAARGKAGRAARPDAAAGAAGI